MTASPSLGTSHHLEIERLSIRLGGKPMLSLDTRIGPGEVLTVMGPSGSGKSTLLAWIAGFMSGAFEASGRLRLDGRDITTLPPEQRGIGLLFQDPMLFPHLSVAGNLRFGMPRETRDKQAAARNALARIGLAGFDSRDPSTLSGGQQSRVALMRLLLSRPCAVLLDEPFSSLDSHLRHEMRQVVFGHLRDAGLPTLLVTHDQQDAEDAGGQVIELEG